jgi:hypothetical protein
LRARGRLLRCDSDRSEPGQVAKEEAELRHFRISKGALGPSPDAPAQPLGAPRKVLALVSFASTALVLGGCQMLFGDFEELPAEQPVLVCKNNSGAIYNDLDGTTYKECDTAKGEKCISTGSSAVCAQCKTGATECKGPIGAIKFRECVDGVWEDVEACGPEQRCDSDQLGCVDCKPGEERCVDAPEVIKQVCQDNQWVLKDTCRTFDGLPPACFNAPVSDPQDSRSGRCRTCVEEEWACVAFPDDAVGSGKCSDGTRAAKKCTLGCDAVTKQCK